MRRSRGLVLAALLITFRVSAARAQAPGVSVISLQPLSFGVLIPGVPEHVEVTDVTRRAMLVLSGSGSVDITFVLPGALTTRSGDEIPIRFGNADAAILASPGGPVTPLNALQINKVQVTSDHPVYIVVGGSVTASTIQRPGSYNAAVVLVVSPPGT